MSKNDIVVAEIKKGVSKKTGNEFAMFVISLKYKDKKVPFRQIFLSEFESISLETTFGVEIASLEKVVVEDK